MPEALPPVLELALLFMALALVFVVRKFVQALFNPLIAVAGHVPGLGGAISSALGAIESAITNALGSAEQAIDVAIGASFHQLAKWSDWLWRELKSHALLLAELATPLGLLIRGYNALRALVHDLTKGAHSIGKRLGHFERELHGIEHGVKDLSRYTHHVINKDVLPEIRSLDRELTHIESQVIPGIRSIANTAENDVTALQKWITENVPLLGTTALVGAIAWALGQLGLGNLTCKNFRNLLGKWGCGLGSLLDGLLGLVVSALALENVCTLLPILESAFGDVVGPVTRLLTEIPLGDCEKPPESWAQLSVPAGPLPPQQTLGLLPS